MKTKAQIARQMYGESLSNLSGGQKAAVTRAYDKQDQPSSAPAVKAPEYNKSEFALVKFGRPGVNGTKESIVANGTSIGDALSQAGLTINTSKEGIMEKDTGDKIMLNDTVKDGAVYIICPGVDSSY